MNGANGYTATSATNFGTLQSLQVGNNVISGSANPSTGYISNLRIIKGQGVYSSAFTPPTAPFVSNSATTFLLSSTNAAIIDNTAKNNITTFGGVVTNSSPAKYGAGSMYFNGSTSYISTSSVQTNAFGTGDFTVECWIYPTNVVASQGIVDIRSPDTAGTGFDLYFNSSGKLSCSTALTGYITGTATISNNQWTHIALVRSGTSLKTYVNGVQDGSTTNSANFTNSIIRVGGVLNGYFTGYIDDLRISKYARYTSTFYPSTFIAFPDN